MTLAYLKILKSITFDSSVSETSHYGINAVIT